VVIRWLTGRAPGIAIGPVYSNYLLMRDASSVSALAKQMHRKIVERYNETSVPALALGKRPRILVKTLKNGQISVD